MFISEMDAHGNCVRAEDSAADRARYARPISLSSDVSSSTTDEEYTTANNSLKRASTSSGGGGSGLGISGTNNTSFIAATTCSGSRRASAPLMGSNVTITAAAVGSAKSYWSGGIMQQTDVHVESREQDDGLDRLEAELRRRSRLLPRESRWTVAGEHEALRELAAFLRTVTPPPENFMSVPSPSPTTMTGTLSPGPSVRRRPSRTKKRGALTRVLGLFRRAGKRKMALARAPSRAPSRSRKRPASPGLKRSPTVKRKRPLRIILPDTAVAGRTLDGHRHIAISIPIEHAHLGPSYPSPGARHTRSRSLSSADTVPSPRVYTDINYSIEPLTAFVAEPHIGTQLGPLVEEHESLSSRSWEKKSGGGSSSNGSAPGGTGSNDGASAAAARKVRLASRNTFGTVHEEVSGSGSRPTTAPTQASPPRTSDESGSGGGGAVSGSPRTSDEVRQRARHQTLASLAGGGGGSGDGVSLGHATAGPQQRPASAHSFGSFVSRSSKKVNYPVRISSLHPTATGGMLPAPDFRRPRAMSNTTGGTNYSRDSSRDHTLQESIFSERSYLESLVTVGSTGNGEEEECPSPVQISEATFARRFEGRDVIEFSPRNSSDSARRQKRFSGGSALSSSSRDKGRVGSSPRRSARDKGKQRASYEAPAVALRPNRNSGDSVLEGPIVVHKPEARLSGGSASSASATFGMSKSEPAPAVVTRDLTAASPRATSQAKRQTGQGMAETVSKMPTSGRRSRFVESLDEAPPLPVKAEMPEREASGQAATRDPKPQIGLQGKGKEMEVKTAEPPKIQVQDATPTEAKMPEHFGTPPALKRKPSKRHLDETTSTSDQPAAEAPDVPQKRRPSREQRTQKGKEREVSPDLAVEGVKRPGTPDRPTTQSGDSTSPLPGPKDRRERRKSVLLSRQERLAELRAALDKPGSQPSDLVWQRRLSDASTSSSESTISATARRRRRSRQRDSSFPYAPATLSSAPPPAPPPSIPTQLSFARILTVVDVRPSSPDFDLVRKDSIAVSISSTATASTITKASPVAPLRGLGSVTPPESPTGEAPPTDAPSSQIFHAATGAHHGTAPSQHSTPPRADRVRRRRSGRTSPASSSPGRRSPLPPQESSPQRPKTAGKGALASTKAFFQDRVASPQSDLDQSDASAGPSSVPGAGKSILKMSHSEILDRYEALREKQTRDMERRIRRLEKNSEYWLSTMLPILNDMSQTLKMAVANNAQGKEADRDRTPTGESGGRREDEPVHDEYSLDLDEANTGHSVLSSTSSDYVPTMPTRLYLHNDAALHPFRGYDVDRASTLSDEGHSHIRRFPLYNVDKLSSRLTSVATEAQQQQQQQQQQQHSGATTMVDSAPTARGPSFGGARPQDSPERIHREVRRFPLVNRKSSAAHRAQLSGDSSGGSSSSSVGGGGGGGGRRGEPSSQESLRTYQGTDAELSTMEEHWGRQRGGEGSSVSGGGGGGGGGGPGRRERARSSMDTIEPLMRELQLVGGKVSLESRPSADMGDSEVRRMRQPPGPRVVVGFGAFSV